MPFFQYRQNNSGGSFHNDMPKYLIVEADTTERADFRAQELGVYFNGCSDGIDCDCCGDRWDSAMYDTPDPEPMIYGSIRLDRSETVDEFVDRCYEEISQFWFGFEDSIKVAYADGSTYEIVLTEADINRAKDLKRAGQDSLWGFVVNVGSWVSNEVFQAWPADHSWDGYTPYYAKDGNRSINGEGWIQQPRIPTLWSYGAKSKEDALAVWARITNSIEDAEYAYLEALKAAAVDAENSSNLIPAAVAGLQYIALSYEEQLSAAESQGEEDE